nr:ribosomal protein S11 [Calliblepharis sp.]
MLYKKKLIKLSIIFSTNNILYSLTDLKGNVLFWTSSGIQKVKKSKKITSTSIFLSIQNISIFVYQHKYKYLFINIKGFSKNKKLVLKILKQIFFNIILIHENINLPHNGCKKTKKRRL